MPARAIGSGGFVPFQRAEILGSAGIGLGVLLLGALAHGVLLALHLAREPLVAGDEAGTDAEQNDELGHDDASYSPKRDHSARASIADTRSSAIARRTEPATSPRPAAMPGPRRSRDNSPPGLSGTGFSRTLSP